MVTRPISRHTWPLIDTTLAGWPFRCGQREVGGGPTLLLSLPHAAEFSHLIPASQLWKGKSPNLGRTAGLSHNAFAAELRERERELQKRGEGHFRNPRNR